VSCASYVPAGSAAASPSPATVVSYGTVSEASSPAAAQKPAASVRQPPADLLAQINADRRAAGLSQLGANSCLSAVAKQNAQRMAAGATSTWNGSDRDATCGLADPQTGEVAGYWTGGIDAVSINALFMKNARDRSTILFQYYCCVGYAWALGANGYGYASVELG
jgi:cysteine-rich secretory family protein